jgi:hypothetical protein
MQLFYVLTLVADATLRGTTRGREGTHPLIADEEYDNYDLAVNPYPPARKFPFAIDNLFPQAPADEVKSNPSVGGGVLTNLDLPVVPAFSSPETFPQDHPFNPGKDGMKNPLVSTNGIVAPAAAMPESFYPLHAPFPVSPEDRIPQAYSKYFSQVDLALEGCEHLAGYNTRVAGKSQNRDPNGFNDALWTADSGTQPPGNMTEDLDETRCLTPCKETDTVLFIDGNILRKDAVINSIDSTTFKAEISWPTSEPANNENKHETTTDLRSLRKEGKICIA